MRQTTTLLHVCLLPPLRFCYFFLLLAGSSFGANVNSISSGNWTSSSTWSSGGAPNQSADNININTAHAVVVNTNIGLSGSADLFVSGTLKDATGGLAYSLTLSNSAVMTVNGNSTFEGALMVQNNATLTINSGDTLTVGDATFINNSVLVINTGGVLIVNGDLAASNNNGTTINGKILVNGNVTASNNVTFDGSGSMTASGTISTSNGATMFGGTGSCGPPCTVSASAPLPVELLFFQVSVQNHTVELDWATATENNNHHFEIEKSRDAMAFQSVGIIRAQGNGYSLVRQDYRFADLTPFQGTSYYRLKQVDNNGSFKYYSIAEITVAKKTFVEITPNPATNSVKISVSEDKVGEQVHLYNIQGKEVMSLTPTGICESYDISSLPQGIYFLQVDDERIKMSVQK